MKKFLLLLFLTLTATMAGAREWTAYMSYHNAVKCIPAAGAIYTLANGSLFTYVPGDDKVKTYSKATGMNGTYIRLMDFSKSEQAFILVYNDNNIDILGTNDSITNMPEYKNSNLSDKTVNDVTTDGRRAFLATNSGVVVIDLKYRTFDNTYNFRRAVTGAVGYDGKIYASTAQGIYVGDEADNLLDAANWSLFSGAVLKNLSVFAGRLYGLGADGLYQVDLSNGAATKFFTGDFVYKNQTDSMLVTGNYAGTYIVDLEGNARRIGGENDYRWLTYDGKNYWACRGYAGLQPFMLAEGLLAEAADPVVPNSPVRNYDYALTYSPDHRLLIGGGSLNYTARFYEGTVMSYKNGLWQNLIGDSVVKRTGLLFRNVTSVVQDPQDTAHVFASTAETGFYEFRGRDYVAHYDCTNTPLATILPQSKDYRYYVRVSGLTFDKEGNLWMLNNQVDSILHVRLASGGWKSFRFASLSGYPTFDKILFDSRGRAWITHRRTTSAHHAGILCLDYNGTITDTSDDNWKFVYQFTNQDNTSYTFNLVYDVAEDRDGQIWIATDQGPFVLRTPADIFGSSPVFTQVKVPRNDGTNYADYLLSGVPITCIAIDGGNRKWFGTDGNGAYLISADGLETIHHFTAENSPLLSNTVYSIAINGETGEVMLGTDAGLVSYRSDATEPRESLEKSNVKVYPNPVRPDFRGNLRVDGLSYNSDVKITTVSGQLVAQGNSEGGTFTWDLRNLRGHRVPTGVYYVIASDEEGKKGAVAKFVVIH